MKKILTILLSCFASFAYSQTYTPVIANYTLSGKPIGYSQATPADGRSMYYDAVNFIYRPFQNPAEVISFLNLPAWRAGNTVYVVDSGGTLNGNGTYTNFHATFYMFADGVADGNLIKLNWTSGGGTCANCFTTTTQLDTVTYTLNRPNGTHDTIQIQLNSGVYVTTLNNGLTLTGSNGQLGGSPLIKTTTISGGGFPLQINGNIFEIGQGAAINSAAVLQPGTDGNTFSVIGSSAINDISTTNIQGGTHVGFIFTGTPTLSNNVAGPAGSAPMLLAGSVNYVAATGDYIEFVYDAVNVVWHETARKLSGTGGVYTFSNGLTEFPATRVKLGGSLVQPTTIAGAGFPFMVSGGRFETGLGLPILAAGDLVTGNDGNLFHITGTTQINAITTTNFQAGSEISFVFDNIVTLKNNTAGGINTAPMLLAGRVDYTSAVGDYIAFQYDGVNWYETNRKLAGTVTSITANNGLLVSGGTTIQLGAPLIRSTTITTSTFPFIVQGTPSGGNSTFESDVTGGVAAGSAFTASSLSTSFATINAFNNGAGQALLASSRGGTSISANTTDNNTNTVLNTLLLTRGITTGGTVPTAGYGQTIEFDLDQSTGAPTASNIIQSTWTTATAGSQTSQLILSGVSAGSPTTLITFKGNGQAIMSNDVSFAPLLSVTNTEPSNNNTAITGQSTSGGGVSGISSTNDAVTGQSTSGSGGNFQSTNGVGLQGVSNSNSGAAAIFGTLVPSTTNTVAVVAGFLRSSTGTTANNVGAAIQILSKTSTNNTAGNTIQSVLTDASASPTSRFDIIGVTAGVSSTKFSVGGSATFTTGTRLEASKGIPVASTGNLTLGTDGNVFHITGTTQINAITIADWQAGSEIILIFDGSLTVKNNTAGGAGTAVMLLAGGADFSATSNDVLTLVWDGTSFFEKCRSVN